MPEHSETIRTLSTSVSTDLSTPPATVANGLQTVAEYAASIRLSSGRWIVTTTTPPDVREDWLVLVVPVAMR